MKIEINNGRLLPGSVLRDGIAVFPAEGGGFLLPELPETVQRWLNIGLEVLEDHAQAFELRAYAEEEAPRVVIRFGILPGFRAVMAVDLNWLDGHILFPGHRVGTQKVVCHGSRIDRKAIRRAELVSMPSAAPVRIRVLSLSLDDRPENPRPLPSGTWIDRFGQDARGPVADRRGRVEEMCDTACPRSKSLFPFLRCRRRVAS